MTLPENNQFICSIIDSGLMTQAELAKELGVTDACISNWRKGTKVPNVTVKYLNLVIGNVSNKIYQHNLSLLKISIKRLSKDMPTAQSDILDIVDEVFNR